MSVQRLMCCLAFLVVLICVEAAPNRSKKSSNYNESESMSIEAESKESWEESKETDSEHNVSKPGLADRIRKDLLRPLPLPETYGISPGRDLHFIPLAQLLAESVNYVQEEKNSQLRGLGSS